MEDSLAANVFAVKWKSCCFCRIPAVIPDPYKSTLHTWACQTTTHVYSFYICMQGVPVCFCWVWQHTVRYTLSASFWFWHWHLPRLLFLPQWSLQPAILVCSALLALSQWPSVLQYWLLALSALCIIPLSRQWTAGCCLLVSLSFWSCAKWFVIGVSLSEPHTSVTALRTRVYLSTDRPLTINFKWAHSNISRISMLWSMRRPVTAWRATVRVQCRGPRAKTTEVEARVALVCASTDDGRLLTGGTDFIWMMIDCVSSGT